MCPACAMRLALELDSDATLEGEPSEIEREGLPAAGDQIDRYRLLEVIGEGGMGMVFRAEQREPVAREVAIKFIKWGMDTRQVVARFEVERQALALMDHSNIARVFDGGATDAGRPYFVMEYVRGIPITAFCDKQQLSTADRIDLFCSVCDGVQHAHQKGLIHRDLKPSNILVKFSEGAAVPKVIDFGVAKATGLRLTEKTVYTRLGQPIGTPAYMSPEQAEGSGLDVDTRTDVYSLGALLYEILVGVSPLASSGEKQASNQEILSRIGKADPVLPSSRLSEITSQGSRSLSDSAKYRGTDLKTLKSQLRGDLDWIVMKALDRDRTRRYDSPSDLKADLERHLRHEPVLASPPTVRYRAGKFVRRHRTAVTAAALLFAVLAVGVVGTAAGLVRARKAEAVAASEARKATVINTFLEDVLGFARSVQQIGRGSDGAPGSRRGRG